MNILNGVVILILFLHYLGVLSVFAILFVSIRVDSWIVLEP